MAGRLGRGAGDDPRGYRPGPPLQRGDAAGDRPGGGDRRTPGADDGVAAAVAEWERRRDAVVRELDGLPVDPAAGGWSLLLDVGAMGLDSFEASRRLLEVGRVAATPMRDWGEANGDRFVRLVFSNEPVARLVGLGERVRRSIGGR